MDTQLDRHCSEVLHAKSAKDLLRKMVSFSEDRGFWSVSATVVTDHSPTLREYQYITNAPADYMPEFEDMEAAHVDPVSQHAAVSSTPLVWDRSTYVNGGQASLWERQAPRGYRSGIVVCFHLPRGRHFLFGPDNDQPVCGTPAQVKRLVEDVQLFASHAQAAAFELCLHIDPPEHDRPNATPRELEALRWSMDGMTRWDVGRKMGLSERDVALRLQRVMRKLGCSSTYEAVLRAIKLGLIECD
jgi:DNA-binding CsgD family transcriptional regulator